MDLTDVLLLLILLMLTMGVGCIATNNYSKFVETRKTTEIFHKIAEISVSLLTSMSQRRPNSTAASDPLAEFLARGVPPMPEPFVPAFNVPPFSNAPVEQYNTVPVSSNPGDSVESID